MLATLTKNKKNYGDGEMMCGTKLSFHIHIIMQNAM